MCCYDLVDMPLREGYAVQTLESMTTSVESTRLGKRKGWHFQPWPATFFPVGKLQQPGGLSPSAVGAISLVAVTFPF